MMADSADRGSYERRAPDLPRRYSVTDDARPKIVLCTPVVDALDAEPGDEVAVRRNDAGEIVIEAADTEGER
ncbi:hypothetical protein GCM10009037_06680 [Halarchaeum grantii]|uniref:Uncharacterized protein n=1 Tax=Halarchaeum grantii TaxID=1193105 RepID=A0A830EUF3_9EURY|nr:hypothetical protein [Halarchaeum grantii]GGL25705.1 hypothetical protein GCM10009037_06680 [Halarchaeum grantii]